MYIFCNDELRISRTEVDSPLFVIWTKIIYLFVIDMSLTNKRCI